MTEILAGVETVTELVTGVFDLITSNPLLVTFVAASLIGVAIGVFGKLRGAAH